MYIDMLTRIIASGSETVKLGLFYNLKFGEALFLLPRLCNTNFSRQSYDYNSKTSQKTNNDHDIYWRNLELVAVVSHKRKFYLTEYFSDLLRISLSVITYVYLEMAKEGDTLILLWR